MNPLALALAAPLLALGAALPAQQNVGLSLGGVLSTSAATVCGFDCGDPNNTGSFSMPAGRILDVRLFGDAQLPAVVAIAIGPALSFCPGIALPGFHNSLQVLPPNILVAVGVPSLAPGNRICGAAGGAAVIPSLRILPAASGATLTFQGLVFDRGAPTFTRPLELLVR